MTRLVGRIGRLLAAALMLTLLSAAVTDAGARATSPRTVAASVTPGPPPDLGIGCPSPPGAVNGIRIWIHVTKWCNLPGVRGQAQFKLQMQIFNSGKRTLEIGQEHMRLIVAKLNLSRWTPPRDGQATIERPFRTTYLHHPVWAIPANAEDAYDPVPHVPNDLTFATHWGQSWLTPGRTFNPGYHSGDLVFYVPYQPHDPHGIATSADVLGIAYMYGRNIVVICPNGHWGPKEPAASF
jgi:hypothetical protein